MQNQVFEDDKVSRAYLKLALPLVLSMLVTLIYNLADTFFVAQTSNTDLVAGVSLGMPLFTALMALGNIYGQGGSSLLSRLLGQQDKEGVRRVSSFCFYAAILTGVVIGALLLLFRMPMLQLLGASEATFSHAYDYYVVLSAGAPVVLLSFIHTNLLRSEGMSRESMISTVSGALVNIVLDPIFISVLGLGAWGAAFATVLGYLFSDLYSIWVVARRSRILSLDPRQVRIPAAHLGQIFGIGVPAAVVNLMQSASVVLMNQFLLPYGNDKIASMGIVLKASMIALLLLTGLAFGGQPLFGYYYGARDTKRMGRLLRFCLLFIEGVAVVLTVLLFVFASQVIRVFMDQPEVLQEGAKMLRWQVISMPCVGLVLLLTILFQSTGKVVGSFLLSISRQGVIFLIVLILSYQLVGYNGILASQALADLITAVFALGLYRWQLAGELRAPRNGD